MSVGVVSDVPPGTSPLGIKRGFASALNSSELGAVEQSSIRSRFARLEMLSYARSLFPSNQGLLACNRLVVPDADGVELRRRVDKQQNAYASWGQLCTCGLLWLCPMCAARISNARAREFDEMIAQWRSRGNSVIFETFTMRHHAGESLQAVMGRYDKAWRFAWGSFLAAVAS